MGHALHRHAGVRARSAERLSHRPDQPLARRLEIEITETALIRDPARAQSTLRPLKALGVRIAMDDFGTGYSSLHDGELELAMMTTPARAPAPTAAAFIENPATQKRPEQARPAIRARAAA
nr:EAL domain-containing protein [Methylobacterium sp. J-070]